MQLPEEGANKLSRREMMNMLLRLKVDTRTSNSSEIIRLCKEIFIFFVFSVEIE